MPVICFEKPVSIFVGLGFPREVESVWDAFVVLNEWPTRGPAHEAVLNACRAGMNGKFDAETIRDAFEAFAREAGILMPVAPGEECAYFGLQRACGKPAMALMAERNGNGSIRQCLRTAEPRLSGKALATVKKKAEGDVGREPLHLVQGWNVPSLLGKPLCLRVDDGDDQGKGRSLCGATRKRCPHLFVALLDQVSGGRTPGPDPDCIAGPGCLTTPRE
jgi:hypothetical protein